MRWDQFLYTFGPKCIYQSGRVSKTKQLLDWKILKCCGTNWSKLQKVSKAPYGLTLKNSVIGWLWDPISLNPWRFCHGRAMLVVQVWLSDLAHGLYRNWNKMDLKLDCQSDQALMFNWQWTLMDFRANLCLIEWSNDQGSYNRIEAGI